MTGKVKEKQDGKLRILHLRNARGIETLTGPETYLLDLAGNIDRTRFDLRIAVVVDSNNPENGFAHQLREAGVTVDVLPTRSPFDFLDLNYLKRTLQHDQVDLLVTHDARSDVMAWCIRKRDRMPWIAFAHGWVNWERRLSRSWLYSQMEAMAVRRSDIALVASAHMYSDLLQRGISRDQIRHIPIGIDVERYQDCADGARVRDELGISAAASVVGLVGRIHPWKGQSIFIQAATEVLRTHPDTHFLLVGDVAFAKHQPYRVAIESLIQQLDISERVHLTGTRNDIPDVMKALDICVVPSLREPYGLVAIEAQAAGTPVIASDIGGLPEIVADTITGRLFTPGDSMQLAATIVEFLDDREGCISMGNRGQRRATENFSIRAMVQKTESLYEEMAFGND